MVRPSVTDHKMVSHWHPGPAITSLRGWHVDRDYLSTGWQGQRGSDQLAGYGRWRRRHLERLPRSGCAAHYRSDRAGGR